jgi:hypothetical protein
MGGMRRRVFEVWMTDHPFLGAVAVVHGCVERSGWNICLVSQAIGNVGEGGCIR